MPRFYFHVSTIDDVFPDQEGVELADLADHAPNHAFRSGRAELARMDDQGRRCQKSDLAHTSLSRAKAHPARDMWAADKLFGTHPVKTAASPSAARMPVSGSRQCVVATRPTAWTEYAMSIT